jgi:hypothetical protein
LKYDEVNFAKKLEIRRKKIKENTILWLKRVLLLFNQK